MISPYNTKNTEVAGEQFGKGNVQYSLCTNKLTLQGILMRTEMSNNVKLLLVNLLLHANVKGVCWPSQETLAKLCSVSVRTVQRCLKVISDLGLVKMDTHNNRMVYRMSFRAINELALGNVPERLSYEPGNDLDYDNMTAVPVAHDNTVTPLSCRSDTMSHRIVHDQFMNTDQIPPTPQQRHDQIDALVVEETMANVLKMDLRDTPDPDICHVTGDDSGSMPEWFTPIKPPSPKAKDGPRKPRRTKEMQQVSVDPVRTKRDNGEPVELPGDLNGLFQSPTLIDVGMKDRPSAFEVYNCIRSLMNRGVSTTEDLLAIKPSDLRYVAGPAWEMKIKKWLKALHGISPGSAPVSPQDAPIDAGALFDSALQQRCNSRSIPADLAPGVLDALDAACGGWSQLGMLNEYAIKGVREKFIKAYKGKYEFGIIKKLSEIEQHLEN